MGTIVNFDATRDKIIAFEGLVGVRVNLGVGDDPEELVLLLNGHRVHIVQVGDDDLLELAQVYNQARTWLKLDQAAGQPLPYRHLTLVGPQGNGVSITLAAATETPTVASMQIRLHQETLILPVEPDLVADLDTVLLWFLLNAVTWDTGEEFEA